VAIKKLQSIFEKDFKAAQAAYRNKYSLPGTLTVFKLGGVDQLNDMVKGANQVMQQYGVEFNKNINTVEVWSKVSAKLGKEYARKKSIGNVSIGTYKAGRAAPPKNGVYFGIPMAQVGLVVPLNIYSDTPAKGKADINKLWNGYTGDLYEAWVEFVWPKSKTGQQALGTAPGYQKKTTQIDRYSESAKKMTHPTISAAFKINLKKEHNINSTTAMMAVDAMRKSRPSVNTPVPFDYIELAQYIEDSITVDWGNKTKIKALGNYEVNHVLSIQLGSNPTNLPTDAKAIKEHAYKFIKDDITDKFAHRLTNPQLDMSTPIGKQAADAVILGMMDAAIKGNKLAKASKRTAKPLKTQPRKAKLKKAGKTKTVAGSLSLSQNAMIVRRPSEKKKEKDSGDLLRLEALINKRLPAEVRRNMGRPALINQTGRFSNSVEAQNFRSTKAGISGEYTYQLSPYETFENTGRYKWPNGYNPKPLIAKSIRKLALQYAEQKLVSLRRT
jgi:hypothetical protein|tara:strand:- start:44 stop:1537 length:1494 start_codon:yes stop_codon:yes gene_type:complete